MKVGVGVGSTKPCKPYERCLFRRVKM